MRAREMCSRSSSCMIVEDNNATLRCHLPLSGSRAAGPETSGPAQACQPERRALHRSCTHAARAARERLNATLRDVTESLRGGRYVTVRVLGEGAQASTFEAVDKREG